MRETVPYNRGHENEHAYQYTHQQLIHLQNAPYETID